MANVTSRYHTKIYPAIDPTKNSRIGRNVLVAGSSSGIGYAIAKAFTLAGATTVIITSRTNSRVAAAVTSLQAFARPSTHVTGFAVDVTSAESIATLWASIAAANLPIDTLILNAAPNTGIPAFRDGLEAAWPIFETGVLAHLRMTDAFMAQGPARGKAIVNVSSGNAHRSPLPKRGAYGASKAAAASVFQGMADDYDVDELQIVSLHPGSVFTEAAEREGIERDSRPWDSDLVGGFSVWATTEKAAFLHGRFVWVNWDVDELVAMRPQFERDPGFLRIGLQGIPSVDIGEVVKRMQEDGQ